MPIWLMHGAAPSAPLTVDAAETTAFLARTSGLDATHTNAFRALINGSVLDGFFSKFDVLGIPATQDSTTGLLNLVSSSFTATLNGAPTFTIDRGYTGQDAVSPTVSIDSTFNPTTAPTPKFVQNSAHLSVWSVANFTTANGGFAAGQTTAGGDPQSDVVPRYLDGNSYFRINDSTGSGGIVNANSAGHYLSNRSGASAQQGYKNAVDQSVTAVTSAAPVNDSVYVLAEHSTTTGAENGYGGQIAAYSIGGSLTPTDVTNFYNRLRTYMTAVGVP
jgi:hypothetical protein